MLDLGMDYDKIDTVLKSISNNNNRDKDYLKINEIEHNGKKLIPVDIHLYIKTLRNRDLIYEIGNGGVNILTEQGFKALELGYENYINSKEELTRLNVALAQSNLDANEERKNYRTFLKVFTVINVVLAVINLLGLTALGKAGKSITQILSKSPELLEEVLQGF